MLLISPHIKLCVELHPIDPALSSSHPKGDLWVQSPVIIIGNIRSIAEAYRRVMSIWPSMMVGTAEGDLPKLFSPALLA